jgi:lipoprotein-anchoring transpeptidase ErfK/SrfK
MAGEPDGGRRRGPRKTLLIVLAVLVPVIPLAIGIAISVGQPATGVAATTTTTVGFTPVGLGATAITKLKGSTPTPASVPGGSGALVAQLQHPTPLRASPGGHQLARLTTRTQFGSPEVLWVVNHVPGWLGVMSPQGGNNRVAWIAQSAASLHTVPWEIKVSLPARRLTVLKGDQVVARYTVAVGAPGAPTPSGRFAVTDRLRTGDPAGPYGCCILALSAQSPHAIQGWTGGNRIAIHSTPETSSIGQAASHGCVRVTLPDGRWLLAHIPLGTPALISS